MSEFTPTTKQVRKIYATWKYEDPEPDEDMLTFIEEFDRWLASVQADAWSEGWREGFDTATTGTTSEPNPYERTNQ